MILAVLGNRIQLFKFTNSPLAVSIQSRRKRLKKHSDGIYVLLEVTLQSLIKVANCNPSTCVYKESAA